MNKLVFASMNKNAGKTSIIIGLGRALKMKIGYMKPFGERLVYHKKRLWDYDSALIAGLFGMKENPEEMTIGFEYSKLRYMYDEKQLDKKLHEMSDSMGKGKDVLFIEGGKDLRYGSGLSLDVASVCKRLKGELFIVLDGDDDSILDDILFIKNHINKESVKVAGLIINKVKNPADFKETYLDIIKQTGLNVAGIIPFKPELNYLTVGYVGYKLFAKTLAGEGAASRSIKNIFIGATSAEEAVKNPLFKKEDKLIITSGDRSDMILASLEKNTSGIILTNNILPPSNIIARASELNIPLLVVSQDTYQAARQIDDMEPLPTKDENEKIQLMEKLVKENLDLKKIV
ncbi:MAG: AAA family ATPase [Planctomycetes bacterium]|nr:AAA family ATPase [Planctomycetota bacterium]